VSSIFVIVQKKAVAGGHGDSSEITTLAMTGMYNTPPAHPAFTSVVKADEYISSLCPLDKAVLRPFELFIKE
jgi:hypothetical protein